MKARSIKSGHHTGSNDEPMLSNYETTQAHINNPPKNMIKTLHSVKPRAFMMSNLDVTLQRIKSPHSFKSKLGTASN